MTFLRFLGDLFQLLLLIVGQLHASRFHHLEDAASCSCSCLGSLAALPAFRRLSQGGSSQNDRQHQHRQTPLHHNTHSYVGGVCTVPVGLHHDLCKAVSPGWWSCL
jgi:hypothetical protein